MKIAELMKQIVVELGFPPEVGEQAMRHADSVVQGPEIRAALDKELTDEQIAAYRIYVYATLGRAFEDPDFKEEFMKKGEEVFKKN
jgi:hypothetical protein